MDRTPYGDGLEAWPRLVSGVRVAGGAPPSWGRSGRGRWAEAQPRRVAGRAWPDGRGTDAGSSPAGARARRRRARPRRRRGPRARRRGGGGHARLLGRRLRRRPIVLIEVHVGQMNTTSLGADARARRPCAPRASLGEAAPRRAAPARRRGSRIPPPAPSPGGSR